MPTPNTANVTAGVGYLYYGATNATKPTAAPGPDGSAPTGFTYVGATAEGVSLNLEREITRHYIEESSIQALSLPGNSTFTIELQVAEMTLANWKLGVGGGDITSGTLTLSDDLDELSLFLDMPAAGEDRRTVYIPRAVSVGGLSVSLRRAEALQLVTVSFESTCTLGEIEISDDEAA